MDRDTLLIRFHLERPGMGLQGFRPEILKCILLLILLNMEVHFVQRKLIIDASILSNLHQFNLIKSYILPSMFLFHYMCVFTFGESFEWNVG